MKEEDRRALLRSLTDDEYRDVLNVISMMPNINMEVTSEGECCFVHNALHVFIMCPDLITGTLPERLLPVITLSLHVYVGPWLLVYI